MQIPQNNRETIPSLFVSKNPPENVRRRLQHTTHVDRISKEVRCVGNKNDDTALNLRLSSDVRELQQQAGKQANDNTDHDRASEYQQEDADTLKQAQHG